MCNLYSMTAAREAVLRLFRLRDKDLLSPAEYSRLAEAYQFLRNLEHRLQFDEDRQTHVLPSGREELDLLARKMPAAQLGSGASADSLLRELNTHLEEVQEIYERVIHAQRPIYYTASAPAGGGACRTARSANGASGRRTQRWGRVRPSVGRGGRGWSVASTLAGESPRW